MVSLRRRLLRRYAASTLKIALRMRQLRFHFRRMFIDLRTIPLPPVVNTVFLPSHQG